MDASIQSGLFFRASILYAGAATVVFLVYLLWLASIRRNHAEEENRPWLQYIGATIVIAFIVVVLQISPFLGMLPTLLAVIFIPDKLRYHLLAAGVYFCVMFGLTIATRSIDPMDLSEIDRKIYKEDLIDKDVSFAIDTITFDNGISLKIPLFSDYETKTNVVSDDDSRTLIYNLEKNDTSILYLALGISSKEKYKERSLRQFKQEFLNAIKQESKDDLLKFMRETYEKKEKRRFSYGTMPTILQNTSISMIVGFSFIDENKDDVGGYYGSIQLKENCFMFTGITHQGFKRQTALFLTVVNRILALNE